MIATADLVPPTRVFTNARGQRVEEWLDGHDRVHRVGAPARRIYRTNGSLSREVYLLDGLVSRIDGPAVVWHFLDGMDAEAFFHAQGNEVSGFYGVARRLRILDVATVEFELGRSSFAPYLRAGKTRAEVVDAMAACTTYDGIIALLDGAPMEWVHAFERGVESE